MISLVNGDGDDKNSSKRLHLDIKKEEDEDNEQREKDYFERIVNAFRFYDLHYIAKFDKKLRFVESMEQDEKRMLTKYVNHVQAMKKCVQHNADIMKLILDNLHESLVGADIINPNQTTLPSSLRKEVRPKAIDMDKTASVFRQIVREWTTEGNTERQQCYGPLIAAVGKYYGQGDGIDRSEVKILVPGAGLGRLAFELASRGFSAQGNEVSSFMLFPSNFILNHCVQQRHDFYPFVHQSSNVFESETQLKKLSFPDVFPSSIDAGVDFSMVAGNFIQVYSTPENADHFDCIVTCFFLDTASNVLKYLKTLYKTLKPGGLWINLGPLLYHFEDMSSEDSIEPSFDVLREMIESCNFEFLEEKTDVRCSYTQNQSSMLHYTYKCVYFVCRKL